MKILIVVDMQNDFVSMALGTPEAQVIVPEVVKKIEEYKNDKSNFIVFTRDTHYSNYMETLEGKKLPVPHCIVGSEGWNIIPEIKIDENSLIVDKKTFGYEKWEGLFDAFNIYYSQIDEIELCGLCTDICVISNALILRALYPNKPITVDAKCCAGVTPEKHKAALEVMKSCQIDVINE
ncbi:MAG: cysteine hydrolase [Acetobacter sp.]|nr:cysteine hydrolase [Acetobacter sp.]